MKLIRKSKKGFTLMEVVISIFLLAIVWLAAVNIIVISRAAGAFARHKTQAIYVMQQAIENLRKQPFPANSTTTTTVSIDTNGTPDSTADDITGTQTVTVADANPSNTYYKQVSITITWNESFYGKQKQVKECSATYIANDALVN